MPVATISSRDYQPGDNTFTIPQSKLQFTSYKIALTRENWSVGVDCVLENGVVQSNVVAQIIFERSDDGGGTWKPAGGFTFQGGPIIDRSTGLPLAEAVVGCSAKDALTNQDVIQTGLLRVTARILVPLRAAVTLSTVEPA